MPEEKAIKKINYARGISLGITQRQSGDSDKESLIRFEKLTAIDFTGGAGELLESLAQAAALTTGAAANILNCRRDKAGSILSSLWEAGMVRWINVFAETGPFRGQFRLWYPADAKPPKDAQEACRLASFGLFYALAKNEVPGFKWRVIRDKKSCALAEMQFTAGKDQTESKWCIDAPRRGERPASDADVYIFPTIQEGKNLAPPGKMYTADELIMAPGRLRDKMLKKTG